MDEIKWLEVAINTRMAFWTHGHQLALGALLIALGFGLTAFAGLKATF